MQTYARVEIFVSLQMDENPEITVTLDCIPISTDTNQGLETSEVVDYLDEAATTHKEYLNRTVNPPVQPNGGTVFLFDLGPNEAQWENNKKKLRSAAQYITTYCTWLIAT